MKIDRYKIFEARISDSTYDQFFEPNNEVINTIADICIELEDEGYKISIEGSTPRWQYKDEYHVSIDKEQDKFKYADVSTVVDRIKSYLGNKYLSTFTYRILYNDRYRLSNYIKPPDYDIERVEIYFNRK